MPGPAREDDVWKYNADEDPELGGGLSRGGTFHGTRQRHTPDIGLDAPLAHRLYAGNPADLSPDEAAAHRAKPENQPGTPEYEAKTGRAVSWLESVRKHGGGMKGITAANEEFP